MAVSQGLHGKEGWSPPSTLFPRQHSPIVRDMSLTEIVFLQLLLFLTLNHEMKLGLLIN